MFSTSSSSSPLSCIRFNASRAHGYRNTHKCACSVMSTAGQIHYIKEFHRRNSRNLIRIFLFFHLNGNYVIRIGTRQDRYVSMREFLNHAVLSMSDSTMAVSSKYTQDLSIQIVFFTFSCKWCLCFYFWAVIWSYIVDLFAGLHELASAISRTLLKLVSSVRTLLKPYGDTLKNLCSKFNHQFLRCCMKRTT